MTAALMGHCANPLRGLRGVDMQAAPLGRPIYQLAPATSAPLMCRLNGDWLLRESWGRPVLIGDVIEWYEVPQEREDLRMVLQVVVTAVATYVAGPAGYGAAAGAFVAIFGSLAINLLLPTKAPQVFDQSAASPTYATGVNGNQARQFQVIPKLCGRNQTFPPFACQPYTEYEADGTQTFYAVYAIGHGNHEVEREQIDDTDINHFQDITVHQYLAPGVAPSVVLTNVVNAPEVNGANLEMLSGERIGGFAACGPLAKATHIGIDIVAPKGLGLSGGDGTIGTLDCSWRVDVRPLNEFGSALSGWVPLAFETRVAATNETQRWSMKYELAEPMRCEVRVVRTDFRNSSLFALHDLVWSGLRAYLQAPAPLNPHVAHYELVMRASKQLSNVSQQRIGIIATGKARTWSPEGGWGPEVATRNPAWWLAELWANPVWGEGLPDERIDLQSLYELAQLWDARQDRFDFVFDTATNAWDAGQLIARAGRARMFRRGGMRTVARDGLDLSPVTAFTPRNTTPGSMVIDEKLPERDTPDGVVVEYFDNRQWDWLSINCPAPGVSSMTNPVRLRLPGVTGPTHAEREGLYEAASAYYRNRTVQCVTEMQGVLPAFMSPVRWQGDIAGYGQSGDVVHWDDATRVMTLSEPPVWGDEPLLLSLIRDDGSVTDPVEVSPGEGEFDVVLSAAPDFDLVLDDGTRERPKFLIGPEVGGSELVKISAIEDAGTTDDGAQLYRITAVVDDPRTHAVDEHLLPSPGETQDPIDTSEGDTGGGTEAVVNVTTQDVQFNFGAEPHARYLLRANGTLHIYGGGEFGMGIDADVPNQWLTVSPVETSVSGLFEVRATKLNGSITVGTFDTWLSLDSDQVWEAYPDETVQFVIEIRDKANEVVQDSCMVTLAALIVEE